MLSDFFRICHLNNIRLFILLLHVICIRAVARFKILGVPVLFDGNNLPPLPPPSWDRVNWSAEIWECHDTPGTPRDDTPDVCTYYSSTYLLTYQCYEYALAKTYLVLKIIIISFHFCTATSFIKSWNLQFLLCKIKDFVWKFEGFLCQLILKFKSWEGPQKRCSQEVLRNFKWETKEGKS